MRWKEYFVKTPEAKEPNSSSLVMFSKLQKVIGQLGGRGARL